MSRWTTSTLSPIPSRSIDISGEKVRDGFSSKRQATYDVRVFLAARLDQPFSAHTTLTTTKVISGKKVRDGSSSKRQATYVVRVFLAPRLDQPFSTQNTLTTTKKKKKSRGTTTLQVALHSPFPGRTIYCSTCLEPFERYNTRTRRRKLIHHGRREKEGNGGYKRTRAAIEVALFVGQFFFLIWRIELLELRSTSYVPSALGQSHLGIFSRFFRLILRPIPSVCVCVFFLCNFVAY